MLLNFRAIESKVCSQYGLAQLFRSGTFINAKEEELEKICTMYNIKHYIDLRSFEEVKKHPTTVLEAVGIKWHHLPIIDTDHYLRKATEPTYLDYLDFYKHILTNNLDNIRNILLILFTCLKDPTVVGCFAGKDRTGVIIMTFLYLLGENQSNIVDDYCRTTIELTPRINFFEPYWLKKGLSKAEYRRRLVAHKETAVLFLQFLEQTKARFNGKFLQINKELNL